MEIAEHGVRAPTSDHFDDVGVNVGAKKGHGATRAEGTGVDILGTETKGGRGGSDSDGGSDQRGSDPSTAGGGVYLVEGRNGRGAMRAKVGEAANDGSNGAGNGVAAAAMFKDFAADHIFLGRKFKLSCSGTFESGKRTGKGIETNGANEKLDIADAKGGRFGSQAIFTRAEQIVEGNISHITGSEAKGITGKERNAGNLVKQGDGNWFDAAGRRVMFGIAFVEIGKANINVSEAIEAGI